MISKKLFHITFIIMTISPLCAWSEKTHNNSMNRSFEYAPPPKYETKSANPPSDNHAWINGYWNWANDKWVWNKGQYVLAVKERPPINNREFRSFPPSQDHSWIAGTWRGKEGNWSWAAGHYVKKPFLNAYWKSGHWEYRRIGWVWIPGHW